MKKNFFCLFLGLLSFSLFTCSQEKPEQGRILAQINDYTLTLDDFQSQLAGEMEMDKDFKLTKEAKKAFLDQLIMKELMIQEAKRRKLDREEKFIRAIERYWESTLIRDLMEVRGQEIEKRTVVSEEEIEGHYRKMKASQKKTPSLESVRDQIRKEIAQDKKSAMLRDWINGLRDQAKIEVNEELLFAN